jgi:PPOX class probable FMN-dependent enzyme
MVGMTDSVSAAPAAGTAIADHAALRSHYRDPKPPVLRKQQPTVDAAAEAFVAASPLVVLATTSERGTDASPRGGRPGFVTVLDPTRLAFGDLAGNNRLDSYTNIVEDGDVGLLFFVPGIDETLRVNGRAHLTSDADVLERTSMDGVRPKVAVVVEVSECYIHCGKALRRAGMWDTDSWREPGDRPSPAAIITEHLQLDVDPSVVEADLEASYRKTLWVEGGT